MYQPSRVLRPSAPTAIMELGMSKTGRLGRHQWLLTSTALGTLTGIFLFGPSVVCAGVGEARTPASRSIDARTA